MQIRTVPATVEAIIPLTWVGAPRHLRGGVLIFANNVLLRITCATIDSCLIMIHIR